MRNDSSGTGKGRLRKISLRWLEYALTFVKNWGIILMLGEVSKLKFGGYIKYD